jgi:hypothetical protein
MRAHATRWIRPTLQGDDLTIWMSLPRDLTSLTAEQVAWCVAYHAALPLAEIRRRQRLTDRQIGMAWRQRNGFALDNLRVREEVLRRAAESKLAVSAPKGRYSIAQATAQRSPGLAAQ